MVFFLLFDDQVQGFLGVLEADRNHLNQQVDRGGITGASNGQNVPTFGASNHGRVKYHDLVSKIQRVMVRYPLKGRMVEFEELHYAG